MSEKPDLKSLDGGKANTFEVELRPSKGTVEVKRPSPPKRDEEGKSVAKKD